MRPLAVTIAEKTSPNALREETPSLKRAPPECQIPMIGTCAPIAALYADTITRAPSAPRAPPCLVASDAKIITLFPFTSPVAATIPQSVRGISNSYAPLSTSR
ncbi:unannotated protein [freshwater metagenome]|uniref:Unannotated protein n=1 Tax=freshwater metagenome TaxID=449393 RepID=A0A6J6UU79_9ZZZZ